MIYVYMGNGKGKTSACLGQVVRALGRGLRVGFVQFIKADEQAGEQIFLKQQLGHNFLAGGQGFYFDSSDQELHRLAAEKTLNWATQRLPQLDLLILDEILYALSLNLLDLRQLSALFELAREHDCHLILSGRDFPAELSDQVDLISEIHEIKHPWQQGKSALPGLDY